MEKQKEYFKQVKAEGGRGLEEDSSQAGGAKHQAHWYQDMELVPTSSSLDRSQGNRMQVGSTAGRKEVNNCK